MDTSDGIRRVDAGELFKRYWPAVLRRCRDILGDVDAAVDTAQEVFVIIFEKQDTLLIEHPAALLWRMATNHSLKVLRSYAHRFAASDGDSLLEQIACAGDLEEKMASRSVLKELFGRHPETYRTIAVLHLVDGMTLKETAMAMNMSVGTVRKSLRALKKTLAKLEGIEIKNAEAI